MKTLHFSYEISLFMSQDVTDHHFQLKCIPMENGFQRCLDVECTARPETALTIVEDGFGNKGYAGVIRQEHSGLEIRAQGLVETGGAPYLVPLSPMYKFQSAMTRPGPAVREFYKKLESGFTAGLIPMYRALYIMDNLYGRFMYKAGVTSVKTTAEEALAGGSGVCQDYAHILICLLRMADIPARYVAGLMEGEGATHAWVEAWIDGRWIGFDPTHNRVVGERYIKLTHGRDFMDGAVDKGHFTGYAFQSQKIYVKVEEVFD